MLSEPGRCPSDVRCRRRSGPMFARPRDGRATAEFSGQLGEDLRLEMDIEGLTEATGRPDHSRRSVTLSVEQPFIFHQGVLTLGGGLSVPEVPADDQQRHCSGSVPEQLVQDGIAGGRPDRHASDG